MYTLSLFLDPETGISNEFGMSLLQTSPLSPFHLGENFRRAATNTYVLAQRNDRIPLRDTKIWLEKYFKDFVYK
jgi:hypothetical protein